MFFLNILLWSRSWSGVRDRASVLRFWVWSVFGDISVLLYEDSWRWWMVGLGLDVWWLWNLRYIVFSHNLIICGLNVCCVLVFIWVFRSLKGQKMVTFGHNLKLRIRVWNCREPRGRGSVIGVIWGNSMVQRPWRRNPLVWGSCHS